LFTTLAAWLRAGYSLDPDCRTLTVESLAGRKSAHLGALSPLSLGRILLRELATNGLEGVNRSVILSINES